MGWIGVDLDGTLAVHEPGEYDGSIGRPIKPMVERVKKWLKDGKEVRIVTARACESDHYMEGPVMCPKARAQRELIYRWCIKHIGQTLKVTCEKDHQMIELWDDRVVTVERNTGRILTEGKV